MFKKNSKKHLFLCVLIAVAIFVIGGSVYFGYQLGTYHPKTIIVKGVENVGTDAEINADFGIFWEAWEKIKDNYLKAEETKDQDLVYGAAKGMVDALEDPNTVFLPPNDSKKFEEDIAGNFGGIGAEIGIRNDQLIIVAPLKNTPAERAGLRSGDKILKINDTQTFGLNVNEAVKIIRGEMGSAVKLSILRNGWEKPKDFTIIREIITVPTLDWKMLDGQIAYVQLYSFNENTPPLFYDAAVKLLTDGAAAMILDLRNNPGGFLEVANDLAGWFLKKGTEIVTEQFRSGKKIVFRARKNQALKDFPLVIIVNQGSASAAEILAGTLRDNRGIKLIGEKTFGKGTVQELLKLRDNSTLKVTVANWILPSGKIIDKNGLVPDFEIKLTDEDIKEKKDPQLEKAIEILKNPINE